MDYLVEMHVVLHHVFYFLNVFSLLLKLGVCVFLIMCFFPIFWLGMRVNFFGGGGDGGWIWYWVVFINISE